MPTNKSGGRRKRPPRKVQLNSDSVTIKAVLTFKRTFGTPVGPDEFMSEGDILLDALAAQSGEQNGAKEALLLRFTDPETGEDSAIYRCILVDEA